MSQNKLLYTIYLNLYEYLSYRKIKPKDLPKEYSEFEKTITNYNFIDIETEDDKQRILLIYNDPELLKLNEIKKIMKFYKKYNNELLLITSIKISNAVNRSLLEKYDFTLINYTYSLFKIVFPKHILCSKHEILSEEQCDNLLTNQLYNVRNKLPIIKIDDPMCIWIGAKKNDVVRIERISESVGKSYYYRIVK